MIEHDYGKYCKHQHCHETAPVYRAVCALHGDLNCYWQSFVTSAENKIRQQIVVPYPHGIQYGNGYCRGFEYRKHYHEKFLDGIAAVYFGGFFKLQRNAFHKAAEHENRQPRAESQIYKDYSHGIVKLQLCYHKCHGIHYHLKRHYHAEQKGVVKQSADRRLYADKIPCRHRSEQRKDKHRQYRDEKGSAESARYARAFYAADIVFKACKGLLCGKLEGTSHNAELCLERVQEHYKDRD